MSAQNTETAIKNSLTNYINNCLQEFIPEVDRRITYFIDNNGNGTPDWQENQSNPINMWAVYDGK